MSREGALGRDRTHCFPGKELITCLWFKGLDNLEIQTGSKSTPKGDMGFPEYSTIE